MLVLGRLILSSVWGAPFDAEQGESYQIWLVRRHVATR